MALRKLERRNYGGKWPVSIKYQNLHSFKEGLILLCQSILETRRITHLHGSAPFTIPLRLRYCDRTCFCAILICITQDLSSTSICQKALFFSIVYGAMAKWLRLWILNPGVPGSKSLGGFTVNISSFQVDQMITKNYLRICG